MAAGCCPASGLSAAAAAVSPAAEFDFARHVVRQRDGTAELYLVVENMHCPACIRTIEGALNGRDGVVQARVNLTERRLHVVFDEAVIAPDAVVEAVTAEGYRLAPYDPRSLLTKIRALLDPTDRPT